jgi:ferritin-like metal-binding protein YciE
MTENNLQLINLHNLLDHDACNFSCAEAELKTILPQWISMAESLQLKTVLNKYMDYVENNLKNIEEFCVEEDINSVSASNRIMKAFIDETEVKTSMCADKAIRDACLVACIQAINHFKISMYGTAAAFALELGMEKHAKVFHESEVKEKQIDDRLSQLAKYEINVYARTPIILEQIKA